VSIGANVTVGAGVRIRESIVMDNTQIRDHSIVLYSIIGKNSRVGEWARVEGTPCDPNPDKPFAKMENQPLFNIYGQLNPSATILGKFPPSIFPFFCFSLSSWLSSIVNYRFNLRPKRTATLLYHTTIIFLLIPIRASVSDVSMTRIYHFYFIF
jgi:NDP-sugar pyrophosphorylase family protein